MQIMAFSINNFLHVMYDPLVSEQVYKKLAAYLLTKQERRKWGYPIKQQNGEIICKGSSFFKNSSDPLKQKCRCGKNLSIVEKNWYIEEEGCYYHPSKANFLSCTDYGIFPCCKSDRAKGCTLSKYHVCDFKAVDVNFIQAEGTGGTYKNRPCNIYALDCEMVYTTKGMELARITLVALNGRVVLDSFVQPSHPILDYNTKYSGVTSKHLEGVSTTIEDVQKSFLQVINTETLLIGHSLENDLISLQVYHKNVIDVASVFPHQKGFPYRMSLKSIAEDYLYKSIQNKDYGHDSVEDSITCIELLLWKVFCERREIPELVFRNFTGDCHINFDYCRDEEARREYTLWLRVQGNKRK